MKRMMEARREIDLVIFSNYLSTQDTDTNLKKNHLPRIHSFFLHSREKGKEKEKGKIGQRDGRWLRERERKKTRRQYAQKPRFPEEETLRSRNSSMITTAS